MNVPSILSRRRMIGILGFASITTVLAACSQSPGSSVAATTVPGGTPTPNPGGAAPNATPAAAKPALTQGQKLLTLMFVRPMLSEKQQAQYEKEHPDIRIYFQNVDLVALMAESAAGTPPDIFRVSAPDLPGFLVRKILYDLTPYYKASSVLKISDMAPADKNYWYAGLESGKGEIYGEVNDWSPDMSLWINAKMFQEASLPIPGETEPLTSDQIVEYAQKLTKKVGDRTTVMGFGYGFSDGVVEANVHQLGASIWAPDFSKVNLHSDQARKVLQFHFNLAKANTTYNPLNPPPSNPTDSFKAAQAAMVQAGYYYGAQVETDKTRGDVHIRPAIKFGTNFIDPCLSAVGTAVHAKTKIIDDVWKFLEWMHGGQPAIDRATSGWGVPGLLSLYKYMPDSTPFQKEVQRVLTNELKFTDTTVRFNPYISQEPQSSFTVSWLQHLEAALRNQETFDQVLSNVEKDVNNAIQDGMSRMK